MIRKINILLAVVFAVMFAIKSLKSLKDSRAVRSAPPPAVAQADAASTLSPNVYYIYWAGYSQLNPITNRNGVLLDIVRAVFPNATLMRECETVDEVVERLRSDDRAVLVGLGAHDALKEFPVAPTPLMYTPLVLLTLRTNPWRYTDYSSLTNLKIIADCAYLDCAVLRQLQADTAKGGAFLRTFPSTVTKVQLAEMVLRGEADGFAMSYLPNSEGTMKDGMNAVRIIQNFRKSPPISSDGTLFYVSGKDPAFAEACIADFEKGIRRIDKTGELRRIYEYYGTPYSPPPES